MAANPTFPSRDVLQRRLHFRPLDILVGAVIFLLLYLVIRVGASAHVPIPRTQATTISTSPAELPYYAARSLLRMFIALFFAYAFSLGYAYVAARSRRARRVLIPVLDILQSVPVLGFLAVTVTFFLALFPGSELGLEAASIFAVFTSQAWNITFSFYHSLVTHLHITPAQARLMSDDRADGDVRADSGADGAPQQRRGAVRVYLGYAPGCGSPPRCSKKHTAAGHAGQMWSWPRWTAGAGKR